MVSVLAAKVIEGEFAPCHVNKLIFDVFFSAKHEKNIKEQEQRLIDFKLRSTS